MGEFQWIVSCTDGWSRTQLLGIMEEFLKASPKIWNVSAASALPYALASVCSSAPENYKTK